MVRIWHTLFEMSTIIYKSFWKKKSTERIKLHIIDQVIWQPKPIPQKKKVPVINFDMTPNDLGQKAHEIFRNISVPNRVLSHHQPKIPSQYAQQTFINSSLHFDNLSILEFFFFKKNWSKSDPQMQTEQRLSYSVRLCLWLWKILDPPPINTCWEESGVSRISHWEGGGNPKGGGLQIVIFNNFPSNCMKIKKNG